MGLKQIHLRVYSIGKSQVVIIQKAAVLTRAAGEPFISRARHTPIRIQPHVLDIPQCPANTRRLVRRRIIDNNHLNTGSSLQRTLHTPRQPMWATKSWDDQADFRNRTLRRQTINHARR